MTMRPNALIPTILLALAGIAASQEDAPEVKYKGAGWLQFGRVMHSTDSLLNGGPPNNMNGNWIQAAGVQVATTAKLSPRWEGGMGIGALQMHHARGDVGVASNWYTFWTSFISEARLTYTNEFTPSQKLNVNLGFFPYNYNPEVKNLGLYLLRGYVYPGTPISGFEARGTTPAANIFGASAGYTIGPFKNDLLFISETENRPYFDFSIADVASLNLGKSLQLGAGFNLYRFIPRVEKNNSPGRDCKNVIGTYAQIDPQIDPERNEVCFIMDSSAVDTLAGTGKVDTIFGSLGGTKLMGRFRWDPKATFGVEGPYGKQDFILYGELGVLGTKDYKKYYADIKRRIPVMLGLNLPAFGYLDRLALEVEYYASKNFADYGKAEQVYSWVPRAVPDADKGADDFKWSLYFTKVVAGHLRLSGQVANDHLRMFGPPDIGFMAYAEALTTPKDWYWMLKTTYFF